jgi:alpha-glucoside transport system permease protein
VLFNNLLWIIVVPAVTVVLGLGVAVLADRLRPGGEKLSKTFIFLPMAISMVAAATIWRSIYEYQPAGAPQTGLLNAIFGLFDKGPFFWYSIDTLHFNSLLLMIILIWTQVGYSMVLLSSAIKGVPEDTVEAGRIDGAGERRIFFSIVVPQIWPTVITVFITVLIGVMKVFDVVYVTTNGAFNTDVIGRRFFDEMFTQGNNGYASAIVVILMIAITPVLVYQVRHFRAEEANR